MLPKAYGSSILVIAQKQKRAEGAKTCSGPKSVSLNPIQQRWHEIYCSINEMSNMSQYKKLQHVWTHQTRTYTQTNVFTVMWLHLIAPSSSSSYHHHHHHHHGCFVLYINHNYLHRAGCMLFSWRTELLRVRRSYWNTRGHRILPLLLLQCARLVCFPQFNPTQTEY